MNPSATSLPVLVAGGGIGGVAVALALVRRGFQVKVRIGPNPPLIPTEFRHL